MNNKNKILNKCIYKCRYINILFKLLLNNGNDKFFKILKIYIIYFGKLFKNIEYYEIPTNTF